MEGQYHAHISTFMIKKSKGLNYYPHFHEQAEGVYCLKGTTHANVEGVDYELYPGDLLIVYPNQTHSYENERLKEPEAAITFLFHPSEVDDYFFELTSMVAECPVIRKEELGESFPGFMTEFHKICHNCQDIRRARAHIAVLLGYVFDSANMQSLEEAHDVDVSRKIMAYLNQNYTKDLTITDVSKDLGISPPIISKVFINRMDTTFVKYMNSLRLHRARKLLRSTDSSMKEIAAYSGFKSQRSFFRIFQEECGITPGEYRKQDREAKRQKYGPDWKQERKLVSDLAK